MNKQIVIISRKWNNPKISMVVTDEELSFLIDLHDFMRAVSMELLEHNGNLDASVNAVITGIKGESVRIMG